MTFARTLSSKNARKKIDLRSVAKKVFSVKTAVTVLLVLFACLMIAKPSYYIDATRRGLGMFATTVLPSLFPFYFTATMLTKVGAAKTLSLMLEKPMKKLYLSPKESAYVCVLSMLSGYPVGASCLLDLYKTGAISQADAMRVSAFTSTSGPIFMLGTVGSAIFDNLGVGIIVMVAHYLGALLNGFLYRGKRGLEKLKFQNVDKEADDILAKGANTHIDNALSESVAKSTTSMLMLGGYIVLGGLIIDTLNLVNVGGLLKNVFKGGGQIAISLLFGIVEMTRGSIECAKLTSLPIAVALCTGIISFGGLSVIFQTYSFLSQTNMKLSSIFARKTTQAIISFFVALLLAIAFKNYL